MQGGCKVKFNHGCHYRPACDILCRTSAVLRPRQHRCGHAYPAVTSIPIFQYQNLPLVWWKIVQLVVMGIVSRHHLVSFQYKRRHLAQVRKAWRLVLAFLQFARKTATDHQRSVVSQGGTAERVSNFSLINWLLETGLQQDFKVVNDDQAPAAIDRIKRLIELGPYHIHRQARRINDGQGLVIGQNLVSHRMRQKLAHQKFTAELCAEPDHWRAAGSRYVQSDLPCKKLMAGRMPTGKQHEAHGQAMCASVQDLDPGFDFYARSGCVCPALIKQMGCFQSFHG